MDERVRVGILGATGTVGGRLVQLLADHPWFEVAEVAGSERSSGQALGDALRGSETEAPPALASLRLRDPDGPWDARIILSALPSAAASALEPELVRRGHLVVSNASSHRMDPDVPLLIPEVNPDHLALLDAQEGPGRLLTNPNCVVAGIATALAPLHEAFGLDRVLITTFQAISGAGRPGPAAGDLLDNVLPFIQGEEEKMGPEIRKILGRAGEGRVDEAEIRVSATATRVPVSHGHLASVSVALREPAGPAEVREALLAWRGADAARTLPLAPELPVEVLDGPDRPQPLRDRERGRGMTVTVGRIRSCEVLHAKLMVLSHNLVRGAAGAAVLNAELCRASGVLDGVFAPGGVEEPAVG